MIIIKEIGITISVATSTVSLSLSPFERVRLGKTFSSLSKYSGSEPNPYNSTLLHTYQP